VPAPPPPGTDGIPHTVTHRGRRRRRSLELRPQTPAAGLWTGIDPADLSSDLVYLRERSYAHYRTRRFEDWLLSLACARGVPLPKVETFIYYLVARVQLQLLAPVLWPQFYTVPADDGDDDEPPTEIYVAVRHESEAHAHGMTVRRVRRTDRHLPTLPGCQGKPDGGGACANLRAYGERFCPACRKAELARLRAAGGR
jgi:hypothetical protein